MSSTLAPVPRFIFTILEPLSLFAGGTAPFYDLENIVNAQIPGIPLSTPISATNRVLGLQLCSCYFLLGMIGVGVLYGTSEPKVVRNYLIACAIADLTHIGATYACMDPTDFVDVQNWNKMAWGNIGFTTFLFVSRMLYFSGLLGKDKVAKSRGKSTKKA